MRQLVICAAAALAAATATAGTSAAAREPLKPFDRAHMRGRWYEIARTPTHINRGCQGSATEWTPGKDGQFEIAAICHKGSLTAPPRVIRGEVEILNPGQNTKVKMKVLGGLISRDYWIFDHAADYGWLIMGTPKGDFVSIEATRPVLSPAVRAEALSRARALGYDTSRLDFPIQAAR